jgi:hypothetical protein
MPREPGLSRVLGDVKMDDPSSTVINNDRGIQQLKRRGRDHEHVDRGDSGHLVPREAAPSRGGSVGVPREVPSDSSLAHLDAELEQFAVDARRAPERIGAVRPTDQGLDFGARLGASGTALSSCDPTPETGSCHRQILKCPYLLSTGHYW